MKYFVYKTTNKLNGKEYIGSQSTNKVLLDRNYFGSGPQLVKDIKKYLRSVSRV